MKPPLFTYYNSFTTNLGMKRLAIICLLGIFAGCEKDPTPIVTGPLGAARIPIANAGFDSEVELPLSTSIRLNSIESVNCFTRQWRKISGPACFPADSIYYQDPELLIWEAGKYSFELTGLAGTAFSKDTVNITARHSSACGETPEVQAIAKSVFTELNIPFHASVFLTAGDKVAGNYVFNVPPTEPYNIAIYDIPSKRITALNLKTDAFQMSVANTNEAFFLAGGSSLDTNSFPTKTNKVSIYDKTADLWSEGSLSEARSNITCISAGELVFFAGGQTKTGASATVDIYNQRTKKWTAASLSESRTDILALTDGHKIYFAGGIQNGEGSNKLDIYDIVTGQWSVEKFSDPYFYLKGFFYEDKIYFAGSIIGDQKTTSVVEIKDLNGHSLGKSCLPAGVSAIFQESPLTTDQFALVPGIVLTPYSLSLNFFNKQTGKWKLLIPDRTQSPGFPITSTFLTYDDKLYGLVTFDFWDDYAPSLFSVDLK